MKRRGAARANARARRWLPASFPSRGDHDGVERHLFIHRSNPRPNLSTSANRPAPLINHPPPICPADQPPAHSHPKPIPPRLKSRSHQPALKSNRPTNTPRPLPTRPAPPPPPHRDNRHCHLPESNQSPAEPPPPGGAAARVVIPAAEDDTARCIPPPRPPLRHPSESKDGRPKQSSLTAPAPSTHLSMPRLAAGQRGKVTGETGRDERACPCSAHPPFTPHSCSLFALTVTLALNQQLILNSLQHNLANTTVASTLRPQRPPRDPWSRARSCCTASTRSTQGPTAFNLRQCSATRPRAVWLPMLAQICVPGWSCSTEQPSPRARAGYTLRPRRLHPADPASNHPLQSVPSPRTLSLKRRRTIALVPPQSGGALLSSSFQVPQTARAGSLPR